MAASRTNTIASESTPMAHTRQVLTERQSTTVTALLDAGLQQLREHGYEQLSIRAVAAEAGVTHTTAYAYFTSRAHLVAEMYWRELQQTPQAPYVAGHSLAKSVNRAFEGPALLLGDEPELAQAALAALLSTDPEVNRLRNAIGADLAKRMSVALGPDCAPEVGDALLLAFSGAMLQAGMGYFDFAGVVSRMRSLATLLDQASSIRPSRRRK